MKLPALHDSASSGSDHAQSKYLFLIRSEVFCLFLCAVFSLDLVKIPIYYECSALIFAISLAVMLFRSVGKPEGQWYKCRAIAESVKTLSWRYAMAASPFQESDKAPALFRNALLEVLKDAAFIGEALSHGDSATDQITDEMNSTRLLPIVDRLDAYKVKRVMDQRVWYAKKAVQNKNSSKHWAIIGTAIYIMAAATVLLRIEHPDWSELPTAPLIVMASSALGWVQIKKFNELAAAYTLTAHEIGILQNRMAEITNEDQLSEFVNDAELAFSREHTQWVVRQLG